MPVTAKLSRKFYEKLGDDVANDATYRSDLKQLSEVNFTRFDAKVEQRWAQLDSRLEQRVADLRAEMRAGFVGADAKLEQRLAELETRLTRRMFGFWVAQAATTAALVFSVVKLAG